MFPNPATARSKLDVTPLHLVRIDITEAAPMAKARDYDAEVLVPLHAAQAKAAAEAARIAKLQSDCAAQGGTLDGEMCNVLPPPPAPVYQPVVSYYAASSSDGLTGTIGYSNAWGNCVNEPGVNNPGWGNPIDWPITSTSPWIGASALFYFNHVAVVTGIWSNGDIEIRQQNSPRMPHRVPASMIRGYR